MIPLCFAPPARRLPLLFLLLVLLVCAAAPAGAASAIADYRVLFRPGFVGAKPRVAVRSFTRNGTPHLLVFDPFTLQSFDLPAAGFSFSEKAAAAVAASPLARSLARYTAPPYRLQNHGATRADAGRGVFLTVDLCPSTRPFEREAFETAESCAGVNPAPVAVAITGAWLRSHAGELSFLKKEIAAGRLAVTWVNHSLDHPYDPRAPLAANFLLTPGTDFDDQVLEMEQLMLAQGLVPSPFFRFPGLVSDAATVKRLRELTLIPVGSNAWLAKGEGATPGSFILVHGNGNEPKGIRLLLPQLRGGALKLRPIAEAFAPAAP